MSTITKPQILPKAAPIINMGTTKPEATAEPAHLKNVKKRRRSNVVETFRKVSESVWVSFEAVIIEKTLKEE